MCFKTLSKTAAMLLALGAFSMGCGGEESETAASSALTISGSLANPSSKLQSKLNSLSALALEDYKVRCVTLSGTPQAGEGAVDSAGTFSLSIAAGSAAVNIGCFILKAADSAIVATVAFEASGTGLDGNSVTEGAIAGGGSGGIGLGAINFDPDEGTAIVDKSAITRTGGAANNTVVSGSWVDPTGEWTMTCIDPAHCPEEGASGTFPIYLHQMSVTDDVATQHDGMSIWDGAARFAACGSTEDLNGTLPGTWTADDLTLNADFSFSVTGALPAASAAVAPIWYNGVQNVTTCGYGPVSEGATCDDIVGNPDAWGADDGNFNEADCEALCIADSLMDKDEDTAGCFARYRVNHSTTTMDAIFDAQGDLAAEITAGLTAGVSPGGLITQGTDPVGRHAIGELVISGNTGTLHSENSRIEHYCKDMGNGNDCLDVKCTLREVVVISIVQQSASAAIVDVAITETIDTDNADSDAACFEDNPENHIYNSQEGTIRTEHFLLSGTK